jgi:hypothetical protein
MVEPVGFCSNPETQDDNVFQHAEMKNVQEIQALAMAEFRDAAEVLSKAGVAVHCFRPDDATTPDALFPNNWFSTHPDGTLVLYPMKAENRRRERRPEILQFLKARYGHILDLSSFETQVRFLEGTGSLVLDRDHRLAYAAISERTDPELAERWAKEMDYQLYSFHTSDEFDRPYYHTNVVLSVAQQWAVWCPEVIPDGQERQQIHTALVDSGKRIVELSRQQVNAFCANILELENRDGRKLLAVSTTAWNAYSEQQRRQLAQSCEPLILRVPFIERTGGGGIRCMVAELY